MDVLGFSIKPAFPPFKLTSAYFIGLRYTQFCRFKTFLSFSFRSGKHNKRLLDRRAEGVVDHLGALWAPLQV